MSAFKARASGPVSYAWLAEWNGEIDGRRYCVEARRDEKEKEGEEDTCRAYIAIRPRPVGCIAIPEAQRFRLPSTAFVASRD